MSTIDLVKTVTKMNYSKMFDTLEQVLTEYYSKDKLIKNKNYLLAEGEIPIALVAHIDTVFSYSPIEIFHDQELNILWSPQGLGADDRAGVAAILSLVAMGLKPHIIFTDKEETGGVGAQHLIRDYQRPPFPNLKYLIQLDRRGTNDCVFYNCANQRFEDYVTTFGFSTNLGTFSDISIICPVWRIAGVNLSVGYREEHSKGEHLYISELENTIERVRHMLLDADKAPLFKYIKMNYNPYFKYYGNYNIDSMDYPCDCCDQPMDYYDSIIVKDGDTIIDMCYDCFARSKDVQLCPRCGEWYIPRNGKGICKSCEEGKKNGGNSKGKIF